MNNYQFMAIFSFITIVSFVNRAKRCLIWYQKKINSTFFLMIDNSINTNNYLTIMNPFCRIVPQTIPQNTFICRYINKIIKFLFLSIFLCYQLEEFKDIDQPIVQIVRKNNIILHQKSFRFIDALDFLLFFEQLENSQQISTMKYISIQYRKYFAIEKITSKHNVLCFLLINNLQKTVDISSQKTTTDIPQINLFSPLTFRNNMPSNPNPAHCSPAQPYKQNTIFDEYNIKMSRAATKANKKQGEHKDNCSICMDRVINCKVIQCSHQFCYRCLSKWTRRKGTCPICRQDVRKILYKKKVIEPDYLKIFDQEKIVFLEEVQIQPRNMQLNYWQQHNPLQYSQFTFFNHPFYNFMLVNPYLTNPAIEYNNN